MDGYLRRIQKPLAIVALFAGIVQISGIAVLPYIEKEYQSQLIWFLISFPVLMVILFFLTINFCIRVISKQRQLIFPKSGKKFNSSTRYEIEQNGIKNTKNSIKPKTIFDGEPLSQKISKAVTGNEATEQTGEKFMRVERASGDRITWK